MNKNIKQITAITIMLALIVGCFAAMPLQANARTLPTPKNYKSDFDYDALYVIVNGHDKGGYRINNIEYGAGDEYLYQRGNIFYIGVKDDGEKEFFSFCGNPTSERFAGDNHLNCKGYMVSTPVTDEIYLTAFNYIETEYGNLDDNRVITQTVIWALLGAVKVEDDPSSPFMNSALNDAERYAVKLTLAFVDSGDRIIGPVHSAVWMFCNEGHPYEYCQPQIVPLYKPEITLKKTVDGQILANWITSRGLNNDFLMGMHFSLFDTKIEDGKLAKGVSVNVPGTVDITGVITFDPIAKAALSEGWYVVVEDFTGAAAGIFEEVEPLFIYIGTNGKFGFDYEAKYTIVNGYSNKHLGTLGYPGLTNTGDFFYIGVTNVNSGKEYASYCANGGSERFAGDNHLGCTGYMTGTSMNDARYLSAFNYIEDNIGNLNENRRITQTVIWALLGNIDVDSAAFGATNLSGQEKEAVKDVMANYAGYSGSGTVVDVVYMVCENPAHTFEYCQPQIVPIYDEVIDNKVAPHSETGALEVSAKATLKTITKNIKEFWQREMTPYQTVTQYISQEYSSVTATTTGQFEEIKYDTKGKVSNPDTVVVKNSNHFTYAKLSVAALAEGPVPLTLVVGNGIDKVGAGSVTLQNGKLELTFDDFYGKYSYGAVAFSFTPNAKNGNIHSFDSFSHNNNKIVNIYETTEFQSSDKKLSAYDKDWTTIVNGQKDSKDYIYLYVHFATVQFDRGTVESAIEWKETKAYEFKFDKVIQKDVVESDLVITFTVFNDAGDDVTDKCDKLDAGEYTVTYYIDGEEVSSKKVTVTAGETATSSCSIVEKTYTDPVIHRKNLPDIEKDLVIIKKTVTVK